MYLSTFAAGVQQRASAPDIVIMGCGCSICMGKSSGWGDKIFELPSTMADAVPGSIQVASDSTIPGTISPGEAFDTINLQVVTGQTYSVALRGVGANGLADPEAFLLDQNGTLLITDDDGGRGLSSLLTFTATATGTYTIRAQSHNEGDVGDYTVDVWARGADEVPDLQPATGFDGAVDIGVGTTFGYFEASGDLDTYRVLLQAGNVYTFELAAGADELVPVQVVDTIISLWAADGTLVRSNDDINGFDFSSRITFTATETGYFYVGATSYPNQIGGYTLDMTQAVAPPPPPPPPVLDPIDPINILGTIAAGETFDAISLDVIAGRTYSVALRGRGDNALEDPLLGVYDEDGTLLVADDDGGAGTTSLLTFIAATTASYTLRAQSFTPGDVGDYSLDVWVSDNDRVPDLQPPASLDGATEIGFGTTFGHIEQSNDIDTYKVLLEAGKVYTFALSGGADVDTVKFGGPGELDPLLVIWDASGTLLTFNDDIGDGDLNSAVSFSPTEGGYYFIGTVAWPESTFGGYTLDVTEIDPAQVDPRDSINWFGSENIPTVTVDGVETAYVYFGDSDENFDQFGDDGDPMVTIDWNAYEKGQVMLALGEFERILGIDYQITTDESQATFRLLKTESDLYGAYFFPRDVAFGTDSGNGVGVFNVLSGGWSFDKQQSLQEGGYAYSVILHEFGHAHGLAHPHDTGGGSEIMLGVTGAIGSLGLFNLNQGVYSVMSYNDGWVLHPDGPNPISRANIDRGFSGTLSALDISVLQQRYGVVDRATSDDVYRLDDANVRGTFYETIWDSAGTDEIRYDGARAAQIDLTAATLDYTPTGGGVVSFVDDIFGGYTIAGGVVIENATGGSGNDVLLGNAAANVLTGNAGNDTLMGRDGNDLLIGGDGVDVLMGGAGDDRLQGGNGVDRFVFEQGGGIDTIIDFRRGDKIDLSAFLEVDRSDIVMSRGRIFIENGDDDITILYSGDRVSNSAFLFADEATAVASPSIVNAYPVDGLPAWMNGALMPPLPGYGAVIMVV